MSNLALIGALAKLHQNGCRTVTANQVAEELWPSTRHQNTRGQVFNMGAGIAGRMLGKCKAVVRINARQWEIIPERLGESRS